MKLKFVGIIIPLIAIIAFIVFMFKGNVTERVKLDKIEKKLYPSDWFYDQRAYPNSGIDIDPVYRTALQQKENMQSDASSAALWTLAGPKNIGGRITAIVADPANTNIIIVGTAAGGIYKTTNGGTNWTAKTDNWPSLAVGSLAMDPTNSNIIYCGTGESNNGTDIYGGFGLLKSTDKGETWTLIGLQNTKIIAEIKVHPLKPTLLYAAASGGLYSKGNNRGIYKSNNSGLNWTQVFFYERLDQRDRCGY